MKKSKKGIIIGISILLIIILLILGLTYAYYRTRVIGNETEESVKARGTKLEVTYNDGNAYFQAKDSENNVLIEAGSKQKVEPGDAFFKEFTVENTGDMTVNYSIKIDKIDSTFTRMSDWTYELIQISDDGIENKIATDIFTKHDTYLIGSVSIDSTKIHSYKLIVRYEYLEFEDQSIDMGGILNFRVTIDDETGASEIFANATEGTLLKAIGENNVIKSPITDPGNALSNEDESILSFTNDDFGESYYFRGNVKNNYVNFLGMCFRIVRIDGNSNIKLIMEDSQAECNSESYTGNFAIGTGNHGYDASSTNAAGTTINKSAFLSPITAPNRAIITQFKTYEQILAKKIDSTLTTTDLADRSIVGSTLSTKLSSGNWCIGNTAYNDKKIDINTAEPLTSDQINERYANNTDFYYNSYGRLGQTGTNYPTNQASLKCYGTNVNTYSDGTPMYVGGLTADEVVFAGTRVFYGSDSFYLLNDYIKTNKTKWWTISLGYFSAATDQAFYVFTDTASRVTTASVIYAYSMRPAITLNSNVTITEGVGTKDYPYVVE